MKTNATRILDSLGIRYELRDYEVDPEHLDAETVAAKVGMPAEQVFKTLVVCGQGRECYFAVVPGNAELDLKALAKLAGERRIELAPLKDVQTMTGYIRGGVTVMGAKKDFPVYLDETAWLYDTISVSAGVRGSQILLAPEDYIGVTQATVAPIAREKEA